MGGARRGRASAGERGPEVGSRALVCAECRHAQLLRRAAARASAPVAGRRSRGALVFSGQPACDDVQPRRGDDRTLAWCSLRAATTHLRFARVRPHLY